MIRKPFAGEQITTPDGDGIVISVTTFSGMSLKTQKKAVSVLTAALGKNFEDLYFRVEVEVGDALNVYECWDVEYDSDRDPEDAPWREPKPDS